MREMSLLNNRQAGRRRGRTGQRPQGNNGRGQEQGNRIDNRARGNAPQLLEKYKTLARDAQMQGDRVMTEYYLQFADHYFRVVAEMRSRQEESRRQRDEWQGDDADQYMGDADEAMVADGSDDQDDDQGAAERAYEAQRRQPRQQQREGQSRDNRPRDNRGGEGDEGHRQSRPPRRDGRDGEARANQARRVFAEARGQVEPAMIDANVVPPAFGSDGPVAPMPDLVDVAETASDAPPKRRGRPRKTVADDAVA